MTFKLRTFLVRFLAFVLLLSVSFTYFYFAAKKAEAAWFDDGWRYRVAIPISAHTTAESNVYLSLTGADGINTTDTTKFQSDCGDIRFTDSAGDVLPYFLTTACGLAQTGFHVFLTSFPAGAQTIYYYYGNAGAPNGFTNADFPTAATGVTFGTRGSETNSPVSPIAFWRMDEGFGQTINNTMGTAYPATRGPDATSTTTDPSWATEDMCISGKCLSFVSSSSQYVNISTSIASVKTIGFWVRPTSNTTSLAALNGAAGNASISASSGTISAGAGFTTPTIYVNGMVSSILTANNWQYITVTTATGITASNITLGRVNTGYLNGYIDEVKVYGTALTSAQVKANYAAGIGKNGGVKGTSVSFGSSPVSNLSNGLVGYWKMDEASWTVDCSTPTVFDSSGNGLTLTACPAATGPAGNGLGKYWRGGTFDGSNDYLQTASTVLNLAGNITISVWVNPAGAPSGDVYIVDKTNNNQGYSLGWNSTLTPRIRIGNGSSYTTVTATTTLTTGIWTHVVGTISSTGTASIYINGVLNISNTVAALNQTVAENFMIGGRGGVNTINATIDEVRVYSRSLTAVEVNQIYKYAPGPVGLWNLDENTGISAYDSSGNGNTGTLTNSPVWGAGKFGGGVYFDPSSINKSVTVPSATAIDNLSQFTYSLWVKPSQLQATEIISKGSGVDLSFDTISGGLRAQLYINCTVGVVRLSTVDDNLSLNVWHHIAFTWDGKGCALSNVELYLDGVRAHQHVNSTDGSGARATDSGNDIEIGNLSAINQLQGRIDEVRLYNYALSPAQIAEDMGTQRSANNSPSIYWKLDEGYGTTANNSGFRAPQQNGTLSGPVWKGEGKIGKAVHMSTTTNFISAGTAYFLDRLTALSTTFWINPQSLATSKGILSRSNFSSQNSFAIVTDASNSQEIRVYIASTLSDSSNYFTTSGLGLVNGTWAHLSIQYDATQAAASRIKVYKNGRQVGGTVTGTIPVALTDQSSALLKLGATDSASYTALNALYDEVKIYVSTLTLSQLQLEQNQGKAVVLGSVSTSADGITASNSASRVYCIPGDTSVCSPPVGEWEFNENTGVSSNDTSGNNGSGTFGAGTAAPQWTIGKKGSALLFDGSNDIFNITQPFSLTTAENITIEAWVKLASDTSGTYANIWGSANGPWFQLEKLSAGNYAVFFGTLDTYLSDTIAVSMNNWYHLVAVREGTNVTYYVNGQPYGSVATTEATKTSATVYIGNNTSTEPFSGVIDEVQIFKYVRTPAQVAWDYNRGEPLARYKFDECQGLISYNSAINGNGKAMGLNSTIMLTGNTAGTCASTTITDAWYLGAEGKYNSALGLDGNDYSLVTDTAQYSFSSSIQDFSIFSWIKRAAVGVNHYILSKEDAINDGWNVQITSGNLVSCAINSTIFTSSSSIDTNWHHIGCVIDRAGNGQVYIDGRPNGTPVALSSAAMAISSPITTIGARNYTPSGTYFNGLIDDLRIYTYALTQKQIYTIMNEGSAIRFGP